MFSSRALSICPQTLCAGERGQRSPMWHPDVSVFQHCSCARRVSSAASVGFALQFAEHTGVHGGALWRGAVTRMAHPLVPVCSTATQWIVWATTCASDGLCSKGNSGIVSHCFSKVRHPELNTRDTCDIPEHLVHDFCLGMCIGLWQIHTQSQCNMGMLYEGMNRTQHRNSASITAKAMHQRQSISSTYPPNPQQQETHSHYYNATHNHAQPRTCRTLLHLRSAMSPTCAWGSF